MNYKSYDNVFNVDLNAGATPDGDWEIARMCRTDALPPALTSYDRINREEDHNKWIYFCIHDKQFMSIWNNPWKQLPRLQEFAGIIAPDFSLFWKYPRYMQLEAVAHSRAIGAWAQRNGVLATPFMRWGLENSYGFAFDGVEPGGTVAVGTIGCLVNKEARKVFEDGFGPMRDAVKPSRVLVCGSDKSPVIDEARQDGIEVISYAGNTASHFAKKGVKNGQC